MTNTGRNRTGFLDPRSDAFVDALTANLKANDLIDDLSAHRARRAQAQSNERFDLVLVRLGLVTDTAIAGALASLAGLPLRTRDSLPQTPIAVGELDPAFLRMHRVLPVEMTADKIVVAAADPFDQATFDALAFALEQPVQIEVAASGDIVQAIERLYGKARGAGLADADLSQIASGRDEGSTDDVRRLEDMASQAPVIRLVQELVERAAATGASDIHIEPLEDSVRVRLRIDGALHTTETLPLSLKAALGSRVKVMAGLNIAERRLPQDGRMRVTVRGRDIDLRVSTMPTITGESVVLRILDRSSVDLDFVALGFGGSDFRRLKAMLAEPNGIILVTGPTGSGKTTTLYTALGLLDNRERKLFTVEDPIEYRLAGVSQIQVNPRIGLSFAAALRSILRQDPDIIMVGEIRDLETAEIAVRASLTGHLVLSTVHTNGAAATVTRLIDMGIENYLLASSLKGVLAQRLVRRLCDACARPEPVVPPALLALAARRPGLGSGWEKTAKVRSPRGCPACRDTGFSGRTTISELLAVDDAVRDVLAAGEKRIEAAAQSTGMTAMLDNGLSKVLSGTTTLEEVLRVTRFDDAALPV